MSWLTRRPGVSRCAIVIAVVSLALMMGTLAPALDFVSDFGPELKIQALAVDGPCAVYGHVKAAVAVGEKVVEGPLAREKVYVGHADERDARPTVGAHGAVGASAQDRGGLAAHHEVLQDAVLNDIYPLCRHAFIVIAEGAQALRLGGVGDDIDYLRPVAEVAEHIGRDEARPRVRRLHAEYPVEFGRMADGFVDLERELAALEDDSASAFGQGRRPQKRCRLASDARRMGGEVHAAHKFESRRLEVPPERMRPRTHLRIAVADGRRHYAAAALDYPLLDVRAFGGCEDGPSLEPLVSRTPHLDGGFAGHGPVGREKYPDFLLQRHLERILLERRRVIGDERFGWGEFEVFGAGGAAGAGDLDRFAAGLADGALVERGGGGEAPGPLVDDTHADAARGAGSDPVRRAVSDFDGFDAGFDEARVAV